MATLLTTPHREPPAGCLLPVLVTTYPGSPRSSHVQNLALHTPPTIPENCPHMDLLWVLVNLCQLSWKRWVWLILRGLDNFCHPWASVCGTLV